MKRHNCGVFGLDGGPWSAASSWILLQGPVEHSGLHCGQWGAGGFCIFVSSATSAFLSLTKTSSMIGFG